MARLDVNRSGEMEVFRAGRRTRRSFRCGARASHDPLGMPDCGSLKADLALTLKGSDDFESLAIGIWSDCAGRDRQLGLASDVDCREDCAVALASGENAASDPTSVQ
jgi:hypothetical protein